jgi:hypothetical protein
VDDLFDTVILLKPEKDATIQLDIIRNNGVETDSDTGLKLDPSTMMVKAI